MNQFKTTDWKVFYPDQGETIEDAIVLRIYKWQVILDAEQAAERACEYDYDDRDGWERGPQTAFPITIISPTGELSYWTGYHEPSITHVVRKTEEPTECSLIIPS